MVILELTFAENRVEGRVPSDESRWEQEWALTHGPDLAQKSVAEGEEPPGAAENRRLSLNSLILFVKSLGILSS